jgi:hypothetical protein
MIRGGCVLLCIVMLKALSVLWLLELVGRRCNICKNTYDGYWRMIVLWRRS